MSGQRPRYVGPELRGPADADHFRVKVGRYGDRWYTEQLPTCVVAEASEWIGPSISICKKASGNDWSFVALKRVAEAMETEKYRNLARWPYADRYEALKAINKVGLNAAAQRGTNVHLAFDALLHGQPMPITDDMPGADYRGAITQFFEQYNPTLVAAEFVCIHRDLNGAGYGGTCDAIIEIDGLMSQRMRYLVDWKSRGADSEHGAYPEEAAQVGGYGGSQYIIVEGDHGPERRLMPELRGGLIVSVKPDGCRVYPVELDKAFTHWTALHAWWVARQDERVAVGKPLAPRKNSPGAAPPSVAPVTAGEDAPPDDSPAIPNDRLAIVDARATLATTPSQGADLSDADAYGALWGAIRATYDALNPASRAWIAELSGEATRRGLSFHTVKCRTERSYHVARGLVAMAAAEADNDEILRALLALVVGDVALFVGCHPGHVLGSLSHLEAEQWADLVDTYNGPGLAAWIDIDGTFRLREVSPA